LDVREVEVEFIGPFQEIAKCRCLTVKIDKELTLFTFVKRMGDVFGSAFERKLDLRGEEHDDDLAAIIVNGTVIEGSRLTSTKVRPGDHVVFAPSLAGGG